MSENQANAFRSAITYAATRLGGYVALGRLCGVTIERFRFTPQHAAVEDKTALSQKDSKDPDGDLHWCSK